MKELIINLIKIMWPIFLAICYIIFRGLREGYIENNKVKDFGITKSETIHVSIIAIAMAGFSWVLEFNVNGSIYCMLAGFCWTFILSPVRIFKSETKLLGEYCFSAIIILTFLTVIGIQEFGSWQNKVQSNPLTESIIVASEEIESYPNLDYLIIDSIISKSGGLLPKTFEIVKVKKGTFVNVLMQEGTYRDTLETDVFGFKFSGNVFLANCQLSGTNLEYESVKFTTKQAPLEWRAYHLLPYLKLYYIQISSKHLESKSKKDGLIRAKYLMKNYGKSCLIKIESPVKQVVTSAKKHKFLVDNEGRMKGKKEKENFSGNPIFE